MNTLFFFYTIAMLIICVMTAVLAFAAWASTRRRLFLYSCGVYICYTIEITEIFFFEYISQNQPLPMDDYYAISMPLARTIVTVVLHAFVWLIILDALDKHSRGLFFGPMVAFIAGNIFVLTVVPEGPMRQWLYYTLRQVFSLATLAYGVWCYRNQADTDMRARLARLKRPVIAAFALLLLIVAEDTWVILLSPPSDAIEWLPLYLSERNFTENILLIVAAVVLMVTIYHVLSIRIQEAPSTENVSDLERHIDDIMPHYRREHGLSEREAEVLRLVVMKKTNQEIASELVLAVGTIKSHVHNLTVKTGASSREDLIVRFWQS